MILTRKPNPIFLRTLLRPTFSNYKSSSKLNATMTSNFATLQHYKQNGIPYGDKPFTLSSGGIADPYGGHDLLGRDTHNSPPQRQVAAEKELKVPKLSKLAINGFGKQGKILSRTSGSAIVLRRWTESYWLHVHPTKLVLFSSEEDREEWKDWYNRYEQRLRSNEKPTKEQRQEFKKIDDNAKKLLKWSLNFDSLELVQKRAEKSERKYYKHLGKSPPGSKVTDDIIYSPPIVYALEDVRSKHYDGPDGDIIHNCKISFLNSKGRNISAAFGSTEESELKKIRATIRYIIRLVKKQIKRHNGRKDGKRMKSSGNGGGGMNEFNDAESSVFGDGSTLISAAGRYSAIASEVSTTKYGRNTMTQQSLKWDNEKRNGKKNSA